MASIEPFHRALYGPVTLTPTPTPMPTSQEDLQQKAVAFVLALADPKLTDMDAAWQGATAILAAITDGLPMDNARTALARIRKITNPS